MLVFKFGGASVKNAEAVRNVAKILSKYQNEELLVVVSAMGKTTNMLEKLTRAVLNKDDAYKKQLQEIEQFHSEIIDDLFAEDGSALYEVNDKIFVYLRQRIAEQQDQSYDQAYDQMVSIGELLSTKIVSAYLEKQELKNQWLDARKLIITDDNFREAKVDWDKTELAISKAFAKTEGTKLWVSQGFIGGTEGNYITTLGREGSDYSASIFAFVLDAEKVIIWKDVPGVLNADPKHFNNTDLLSNISYREAIELSYFGASVIHPKTIKPLQNKAIPLFVKSFYEPDEAGSLINENGDSDHLLPSYILKSDQVLLSISPKDYSFMVEEHLSDIFRQFSQEKLKINIMQNSALSFSVSVDGPIEKLESLIARLSKTFRVKFNEEVHLLTIRHYSQHVLDELIKGKEILLEQKTRETVRFLLR